MNNKKKEKIYNKAQCGDILGIKINKFYNNEIYYAQLTYDEKDFMQDVLYVENMKIVFRNSNANNNYEEFNNNNNDIELCCILRKNKKGGFSVLWKKKEKKTQNRLPF